MYRSFRSVRAAALLGLALTAACKDGTGPGDGPGVTVIASPALSDTVDAQPGQLLVMEIRDATGALVRSSPVQIVSPDLPAPLLCTQACSPRPGLVLSDQGAGGGVTRTDEGGRVSLRLRFGGTAGTARLVVSAAGTVVDTLEFTVRPGKLTRLFMVPADTAIYFNTAAALRPSGGDRNGNPTADPVVLSSPSLPLSGATATGSSYGVHTVVATIGAMRAEGKVTVVPRGTLALLTEFRGRRIRVFDLDGSNARSFVVGDQTVAAWGMDWTPDGSALVVAVGGSQPTRSLRRVTMDGAVTPFPAQGVIDVLRPRFSANGEWLYFVGRTTTAEAPQVVRARSDGTAVEEMPNIPWAEAVSPSPDGRRFAWVQGFGRSGNSPINIYDVATGTSTPLGIVADMVAWSPVAERMAYLGTLSSLGIVSADGSGNRSMGVSVYAGEMGAVDWSPDGEWIVHSRGDMMFLLQVSTGLNIPVPNSAGVAPAWK